MSDECDRKMYSSTTNITKLYITDDALDNFSPQHRLGNQYDLTNPLLVEPAMQLLHDCLSTCVQRQIVSTTLI